jgi:RNA polymerase subunit RPABC4/transcription elongation factor Spt4
MEGIGRVRVFVENDESGLICPSCGRRGLTTDQKLDLGPLNTAPCVHCGVPLSVSWSGAAVILSPMIAALVVLLGSKASSLGLVLSSACVAGGFALIYYMGMRVPLEQRQRSRRRW